MKRRAYLRSTVAHIFTDRSSHTAALPSVFLGCAQPQWLSERTVRSHVGGHSGRQCSSLWSDCLACSVDVISLWNQTAAIAASKRCTYLSPPLAAVSMDGRVGANGP